MNELFEHIKEYFNTFNNHDDYTFFFSEPRDHSKSYMSQVNESRLEWCDFDSNNNCIILRIETYKGYKCYLIHLHEIEEISLSSTTLNIKKTNGKKHIIVARFKPEIRLFDWDRPE